MANTSVTKILIVGEPQSGKTSLLHTFMATDISKLRE
jgi:tRNA U34 5-carboxymethylaminomethyl modifying GTPase MnmE/TrmE